MPVTSSWFPVTFPAAVTQFPKTKRKAKRIQRTKRKRSLRSDPILSSPPTHHPHDLFAIPFNQRANLWEPLQDVSSHRFQIRHPRPSNLHEFLWMLALRYVLDDTYQARTNQMPGPAGLSEQPPASATAPTSEHARARAGAPDVGPAGVWTNTTDPEAALSTSKQRKCSPAMRRTARGSRRPGSLTRRTCRC